MCINCAKEISHGTPTCSTFHSLKSTNALGSRRSWGTGSEGQCQKQITKCFFTPRSTRFLWYLDGYLIFLLKSFLKFVAIWLPFYAFVFWPRGMWDLSCPTRDQTRIPLHWKVKSQPLDCQGIPPIFLRPSSIWKFFFATLAVDGESHFSWARSFCLTMKWKLYC